MGPLASWATTADPHALASAHATTAGGDTVHRGHCRIPGCVPGSARHFALAAMGECLHDWLLLVSWMVGFHALGMFDSKVLVTVSGANRQCMSHRCEHICTHSRTLCTCLCPLLSHALPLTLLYKMSAGWPCGRPCLFMCF